MRGRCPSLGHKADMARCLTRVRNALQTGHRLAATTQRADARWTASHAEVPAGAIDAVRDEADSRANHRRTMTNTRYGGARVVVRRRRAVHRLLSPERALMRLKLKRLPHPILTAEQLRTAFRGTLMPKRAMSAVEPIAELRRTSGYVRNVLPAQPVDATQAIVHNIQGRPCWGGYGVGPVAPPKWPSATCKRFLVNLSLNPAKNPSTMKNQILRSEFPPTLIFIILAEIIAPSIHAKIPPMRGCVPP